MVESILGMEKCAEIIDELTESQREHLDWIWQASFPHGRHEWVSCTDVYFYFKGEQKAKTILNNINGNFIQDCNSGSADLSYRLSTLGILACPSFQDLIYPVINLLEYFRSSVESTDYPLEIEDQVICEITQISPDRITEFYQFFCRSNELMLLIHRNKNIWCIKKSIEITRLMEADSTVTYLQNITLNNYRPGYPVHRADQNKLVSSEVVVNKEELTSVCESYNAYKHYMKMICVRRAKVMSYALFSLFGILSAVFLASPFFIANAPSELRMIAGIITFLMVILSFLSKRSIGQYRSALESKVYKKLYFKKEAMIFKHWERHKSSQLSSNQENMYDDLL